MIDTLARFGLSDTFNRIFHCPPENFIDDTVPPIQVELSDEQRRRDPARWMRDYQVLRERGIAPRTLSESML